MTEPPIETGVDDTVARPRRTGSEWLDMVLALSAISISIISLFVAIEHGRTEAKMVAASSWPFLVYHTESDGLAIGAAILLRVENSGVGPARVMTARLTLDGRPVRSSGELIRQCCGARPADVAAQMAVGLYNQSSIVGVLAAHDGVDFLGVKHTGGNAALWTALNDTRHRIAFSVCYCSVLDECWTTDLRATTNPAPVPRCTPGPDDYGE